MKLTKGVKPIRDIPEAMKNKKYEMEITRNYIEIDTDDAELIAHLLTRGFS